METHSDGFIGAPISVPCTFQLQNELNSQVFTKKLVLSVLFLWLEFEMAPGNVNYLILYIPWRILEWIEMSLDLFLNILIHDLDRWEHLLLLLKGKVNMCKKNRTSRITCMNLLPVEVLNTPPFTQAGWFRVNLKRRQ